MRAKTVNFQRNLSPKDAMGLGLDSRVMRFLESIKSDFLMDPSHEDYLGYINLSRGDFIDPDLEEGLELFVSTWQKYIRVMAEMGLYLLEEPDYNETTIFDEAEIDGIKALTPESVSLGESVHFQRGKDPFDAMDIGQKALLREKAAKIVWDWYPDPSDTEEILGLESWHGINKYNIKISRLTDKDGNTAYYAVSDTGEPYFEAPTFYETPGEALEYEYQWLQTFDKDQDPHSEDEFIR